MRIKSHSDSLTLINTMRSDDRARGTARTKVEQQMAGNLPYSPQELKDRGQGYRSNINFRELESNVKIRQGSFLRLLFDPILMVQVRLNAFEIPVNFRVHFESIISEEFHRMLAMIPGFFFMFARGMRNMVTHGVGHLFFSNEKEFIPKSARPGKILFSKNSSEDPDEYDVISIDDELQWDRLFSLIEDKGVAEASKSRGWNVECIMHLLRKLEGLSVDESFAKAPETEEEYQRVQLRKDDFKIGDGTPRAIEITHIFSKEDSGKISKRILIRADDLRIKNSKQEELYLYEKEEEFEEWDSVLVVLMSELGNDGIHSVRGYGHKIYPHTVVSNRMLNTAVDGAVLSSTVVMQSSVSGQSSMPEVLRVGPFTVIDKSTDVVQGSFGANIEGVLQMRSVLGANMANSFGTQRPQSEGSMPGVAYKTARQTDYEMVRNNSLTNIEVMIFYLFADRVYQAIFEKMKSSKLSEANAKRIKKFKERCVKRGIPEEIMSGMDFSVQASRAVGNGSPEMLLTMTREMLSVAPYLQEDGKRAVIRDFIAARVGAENVDRYMPVFNSDEILHLSHQMARFETNDMLQGMRAIVSPDDDHPYHLKQHLEGTMEIINSFIQQQSGMKATEMERFLAMTLMHIGEHLQFISGALNDGVVQEVVGVAEQIKQFHKKMQAQAQQEQAQEAQQAEQEQQILGQAAQMLSGKDEQIKLLQIQNEHKLKIFKEQNNDRVRQFKTMNSIRLQEALTQAKINGINQEALTRMNNYGGAQ